MTTHFTVPGAAWAPRLTWAAKLAVLVIAAWVLFSITDDLATAWSAQTSLGFTLIESVNLLTWPVTLALSLRWQRWTLGVAALSLGLAAATVDYYPAFYACAIALASAVIRRRPVWVSFGAIECLVWLATYDIVGGGPGSELLWWDLPFMGAVALAAWLVGNLLDRHRKSEEQARAMAREIETARESERRMLARELHDVVAHELTLIVVQSELALDASDQDAVADSRARVAETARHGLAGLRTMMRVLQAGNAIAGEPAAAPTTPLPELVQQEAARLHDLGYQVTTTVRIADVPEDIASTADRILREACTNILKHGENRGRCAIRLRCDGTWLTIDVVNSLDDRARPGTAAQAARPLPSGRTGITGLRERVRVLGGEFESRPAGGEWRLLARLPLHAASHP